MITATCVSDCIQGLHHTGALQALILQDLSTADQQQPVQQQLTCTDELVPASCRCQHSLLKYGVSALLHLLCCCDLCCVCRFYKDATYSCPDQGIDFGDVSQQCNTVDFRGSSTLCDPKLGQGNPTVKPCCTPCKDFLSKGGNWFWQCRLPAQSSGSATYKFNMLAGQYYYGGTCDVTMTASSAAVSGCTIADGWTASKVDIYLSTTMKTDNCAPGSFGFSESLNPPQSGNLAPGKSITLSSGQDVFVMLHMNVERPV